MSDRKPLPPLVQNKLRLMWGQLKADAGFDCNLLDWVNRERAQRQLPPIRDFCDQASKDSDDVGVMQTLTLGIKYYRLINKVVSEYRSEAALPPEDEWSKDETRAEGIAAQVEDDLDEMWRPRPRWFDERCRPILRAVLEDLRKRITCQARGTAIDFASDPAAKWLLDLALIRIKSLPAPGVEASECPDPHNRLLTSQMDANSEVRPSPGARSTGGEERKATAEQAASFEREVEQRAGILRPLNPEWSAYFGWDVMGPGRRAPDAIVGRDLEALGETARAWLQQDGIRLPSVVLLDAVREFLPDATRPDDQTGKKVVGHSFIYSSKQEIPEKLNVINRRRHLGADPDAIQFEPHNPDVALPPGCDDIVLAEESETYIARVGTINITCLYEALAGYARYCKSLAGAATNRPTDATATTEVHPPAPTGAGQTPAGGHLAVTEGEPPSPDDQQKSVQAINGREFETRRVHMHPQCTQQQFADLLGVSIGHYKNVINRKLISEIKLRLMVNRYKEKFPTAPPLTFETLTNPPQKDK
jgi:hypothetical protein